MSDATRKLRWRDDPLSLFLLGAAVLLTAMYLLEERGVSKLQSASAQAQALGTSLDAPCAAGSAGADGLILVLNCELDRAPAAEQLAAQLTSIAPFAEAVVAGHDGQLRCPADVATWPNACRTTTP